MSRQAEQLTDTVCHLILLSSKYMYKICQCHNVSGQLMLGHESKSLIGAVDTAYFSTSSQLVMSTHN